MRIHGLTSGITSRPASIGRISPAPAKSGLTDAQTVGIPALGIGPFGVNMKNRKPIEKVEILVPEARIVKSSGVAIGELVKKAEKIYSLRTTQNIEAISVVDALDSYFEELNENVTGLYSTEQANTFTILTEYASVKSEDE